MTHRKAGLWPTSQQGSRHTPGITTANRGGGLYSTSVQENAGIWPEKIAECESGYRKNLWPMVIPCRWVNHLYYMGCRQMSTFLYLLIDSSDRLDYCVKHLVTSSVDIIESLLVWADHWSSFFTFEATVELFHFMWFCTNQRTYLIELRDLTTGQFVLVDILVCLSEDDPILKEFHYYYQKIQHLKHFFGAEGSLCELTKGYWLFLRLKHMTEKPFNQGSVVIDTLFAKRNDFLVSSVFFL